MPAIDTTSTDTRVNLATLASYLESLPEDYAEFEMESFLDADLYDETNQKVVKQYLLANGGVASCGTSACAVGHGPAAGLFFKADEIVLDYDDELLPKWRDYMRRVFGISGCGCGFDFMFGSNWSDVDNTVHGAAARIRYYLAEGAPDENPWDTERYAKYRVV